MASMQTSLLETLPQLGTGCEEQQAVQALLRVLRGAGLPLRKERVGPGDAGRPLFLTPAKDREPWEVDSWLQNTKESKWLSAPRGI